MQILCDISQMVLEEAQEVLCPLPIKRWNFCCIGWYQQRNVQGGRFGSGHEVSGGLCEVKLLTTVAIPERPAYNRGCSSSTSKVSLLVRKSSIQVL